MKMKEVTENMQKKRRQSNESKEIIQQEIVNEKKNENKTQKRKNKMKDKESIRKRRIRKLESERDE